MKETKGVEKSREVFTILAECIKPGSVVHAGDEVVWSEGKK